MEVRTLTKSFFNYPTMPMGKNQSMQMDMKSRKSQMTWMQCSPTLRAQLEGTRDYETVNSNQYVVELLKLIGGLCCIHDQNNNETYTVVSLFKALFYFYQKPDMTNDEYLKEFKAWV